MANSQSCAVTPYSRYSACVYLQTALCSRLISCRGRLVIRRSRASPCSTHSWLDFQIQELHCWACTGHRLITVSIPQRRRPASGSNTWDAELWVTANGQSADKGAQPIQVALQSVIHTVRIVGKSVLGYGVLDSGLAKNFCHMLML